MCAHNFGRKKLVQDDSPSLAEQLSYLHIPKPFKNPHYSKGVNRRSKNLKTMLKAEEERERTERERRRIKREEGDISVDKEPDEMPTYISIEAPPSLLPLRHYCDITGLDAPYTDPSTGLRYHDKSVYQYIKGLSASTAKEYLSARGVNSIVG
ncbi:hypothetical protein CYLTODRAFT_455876 [Cylindrobasidium torrendii FP15055 ss-10]|uniref:Vps72/YL1 C-terminal domain-containing protein n=1 Tax=Cylindrobasidium torrendii FP15055 ss-10 TaxID=1314674 RepID=A0A0D7B6R2_9AGAR|nr:hypothetical protein CYLTODRAFT_455876 [Cylindrobasidium torrendii FP15055 ss-10]